MSCSMGYIYLIDTGLYEYTNSASICNIIDVDKCNVDIYYDTDIKKDFSHIRISNITYEQAIANGKITEQYLNDKNSFGYITGIELNLSKELLLDLIENRAFKFYDAYWGKEKCFMITFEIDEFLYSAKIGYIQ